MKGKYARVEAISPRPEGTYRFSIRMKAAEPMPVTIEALGVWDIFNVTTAWEQYDILISGQTGDYIDLYPLSDAELYVEKLQLTYGRTAYEWRPAPEDDVDFEWTCVALDKATISSIRDIVSYTEYYCALPIGAAAPDAPTAYPPPSPWTATETLDGMYAATAAVSGNISGALVDGPVFGRAVGGGAGIYRFSFDGANWHRNENVISLQEYGIAVSGTPVAGDAVTVTLRLIMDTTMYRCAVTVYSDGSFEWGAVSASAVYDAARAAVNTSTVYQTQVQQLLDSWEVKVRATIVDDTTNDTISDMYGRVQVTESAVINVIDETKKTTDGLDERITSMQEQTTTQILNTFTEARQYTDDAFGPAKEYMTTAQSWQRFSANGIEQGKLGSPFKSVLTNTELGFYENDQRVAYISNSKMMITQAEMIDSLVMGGFEFVNSSNGLGIVFNGSGGSV